MTVGKSKQLIRKSNIEQNKPQHNLDKQTAKTSAWPAGNAGKY